MASADVVPLMLFRGNASFYISRNKANLIKKQIVPVTRKAANTFGSVFSLGLSAQGIEMESPV